MALAATADLGLVLLMSAAFVFALPHMFFSGTVGVLIGVAINIAIAAAVTFRHTEADADRRHWHLHRHVPRAVVTRGRMGLNPKRSLAA
jgi:hypothetical protein